MQFEVYSLLSAVLAFFLYSVPNASFMPGFIHPDTLISTLDPTHHLKTSYGTFVTYAVFDTFTRASSTLVFVLLIVQLIRFSYGSKPHVAFINLFLLLLAVFVTIQLFLVYYVNFVEGNPLYTASGFTAHQIEQLKRAVAITGISLTVVLYWFFVPMYILMQGCKMSMKVVNGKLVHSA